MGFGVAQGDSGGRRTGKLRSFGKGRNDEAASHVTVVSLDTVCGREGLMPALENDAVCRVNPTHNTRVHNGNLIDV